MPSQAKAMHMLVLVCMFLLLCATRVDASFRNEEDQSPNASPEGLQTSAHLLDDEIEETPSLPVEEHKKAEKQTGHTIRIEADLGATYSEILPVIDEVSHLYDDRHVLQESSNSSPQKKHDSRKVGSRGQRERVIRSPRMDFGKYRSNDHPDTDMLDDEEALELAKLESLLMSSEPKTQSSSSPNTSKASTSSPSYEVPLPEGLKVLGLKNRKNYCFLSSLLQIFKHVPGIEHWFISQESNNILHMGLSLLFTRLNPNFNTNDLGSQDMSIDVVRIISGLAKSSGANFEAGTRDDVSEFWTWLEGILPRLFEKYFTVSVITWQKVEDIRLQLNMQEMNRLIVNVPDSTKPVHQRISGKEKISVHVRKNEAKENYGLDDPTGEKGTVWERLKQVYGDQLSDTEVNVLSGVQYTTVSKPPILVIQAHKTKLDKYKRTIWNYDLQVPYEPIIKIGEEGDKEEYQLVGTINHSPGHFVARLIVSYKDVYQEELESEMASISQAPEGLGQVLTGDLEAGKGTIVTDISLDGEPQVGEGDHKLEGQLGTEQTMKRLVDVRRGVWATINDSSVKGIQWDAPYWPKESPYFFFYVKTSTLMEWCLDPNVMERRVPEKLGLASQLMRLGNDLWRTVMKGTRVIKEPEDIKFRLPKEEAVWYSPYTDQVQ